MVTAYNVAYKNQKFTGKISSIDSRVNPITRTLKVRAEIPNENLSLRPGMLLNINLVRQVETLLQLPESTIIPIEDKHFIFVVQDDGQSQTAVRTRIIIGRRLPGMVEVLKGVNQGEQVVAQGALKLRDGAKVKVLNQLEHSSLGVKTQ